MSEEKAIDIVRPPVAIDIVRLLVPVEEAKKQWDIFENLKTKLLVDDDYQTIAGKRFIKRSGFRKIAVFFGISDRLLKEERIDRPDGSFVWKLIVEAVAPNGRTSIGVGACDSMERQNWAHREHDCYSTAHTRAKSRAISDMIAGGLVSAEEIEASQQPSQQPQQQPPYRTVNARTLNAPATTEDWTRMLEGLPWIDSSANWLPPGTLYVFGDTVEAQDLVLAMRNNPEFRATMKGVIYQFLFGKGDIGPETFINAMPIAENKSSEAPREG